jgi:hypothetical protein
MMLHPTQELEPPANPGRFIGVHTELMERTGFYSRMKYLNEVEYLKTVGDWK